MPPQRHELIEINANPHRLDLDAIIAAGARRVMVSSSDHIQWAAGRP